MKYSIVLWFRRFFLILLFCYCTQLVNAFQNPKQVKLSQIYREIITTQSETLSYDNIEIIDDITDHDVEEDSLSFLDRLEAILKIDIPTDTSGIVTKLESLTLRGGRGQEIKFSNLNLPEFTIVTSQFHKLTLADSYLESYQIDSTKISSEYSLRDSRFGVLSDYDNDFVMHSIENCLFEDIYIITLSKIRGSFLIQESRFEEGAYIGPSFEGTFTDFFMESTVFEPIDAKLAIIDEELLDEPTIFRTQVRMNFFGRMDQMYITDCKFLSNEGEQVIYLEGGFDYAGIEGNTFESQFFPDCTVAKQLIFLDNEVERNLIFSELILQGKNNNMHWRDLKGFKLASGILLGTTMSYTPEEFGLEEDQGLDIFDQTLDVAVITYRGNNNKEFEDEDSFQSLISSYYRIYKVFKDNGQIDDANQVYVEMKDVQLRYFKYRSKTYGGLENAIQWRLNSLLRFYTDYGTNPSRAIRISIFVILIFSVFYFFFPSEWDTKSKKQLIDDYKLFAEKNQHGYFKPLMKLLWGFIRSLLNAATLSLNSFVTLGFGTIPTTGLARYVCIIQGFIGWFLLSVFTASLINQVLF